MGCLCSQISRAACEISNCAAGSAYLANCQTNVNSEKNGLSAIAEAVYTGAFSIRGNEIVDAIETLIDPVNWGITETSSDFSAAQATISSKRSSMSASDSAYHAAMAAAAAAAKG